MKDVLELEKFKLKHNKKITIATGKSRTEKQWKNIDTTWEAMLHKFRTPIRTHETYEEYKKMSKSQQDNIKDVGGFVGGALKGGRRKSDTVINRNVLTLDIDFASNDIWDTLIMLFDYSCCIYSTHKHSKSSPRYRLIIPLDRAVDPDEYQAISRKIADEIGIDYFDDTTYQPSRLMYYPSCSIDGEYIFEYQDSEFLNADEVLNKYIDWKDTSFWPQSSRVDKIRKKQADKQGDPTEKEGLIGSFCRTYTIQESIEKFLCEEYLPTIHDDRYTYSNGSTAAGLVIYDNKFAFSNHGTDPCSGKLCNAFDLVRIHKFIDLDENSSLDTDITKLPSYNAMLEFCSKDEGTKLTLGREKIESANGDFDDDLEYEIDDDSWLLKLDSKKNGEYKATIDNIKKILLNDPNLKGKTAFDEFSTKLVTLKDLPWRKIGNNKDWSDVDDSGLRHYLERTYNITGKDKINDALSIVQQNNKFHPIKDYLNSLEWDGVERLDTLFIDYLGAEDNAYTRAVTRKILTAAVARIYVPGIKFDTMLVLTGPQGYGKSTMLDKLGKDWYSDSFNTVQGKEAYEQLQGAWIIEWAEMTATKKVEVEAVKHFISKREDTYRVAYGRRNTTFKRQCVFIGTTNDHEFLRDWTGNRRFWPLSVGAGIQTKDIFSGELDNEVDQIWAEAKYRFKNKESLILTGELNKEAMRKQEEHAEQNVKLGLIKDYIDTPITENWYELDIYERRNFIQGNSDFGNKEGTVIRDKVCALEVWCELFNGDVKSLNNQMAREINNMLAKIECLEKHDKAIKFGKFYGVQRGYKRS